MQNKRVNFQVLIISAIFFSMILTGGACATKTNEPGAVEAAKNDAPTESKDEEVAEALKRIEKIPDSPIGYSQLATIYIRRALARR